MGQGDTTQTTSDITQLIEVNEPAQTTANAPTDGQHELTNARKSQRAQKVVMLPNCEYLNEVEQNIGDENDPISYISRPLIVLDQYCRIKQ